MSSDSDDDADSSAGLAAAPGAGSSRRPRGAAQQGGGSSGGGAAGLLEPSPLEPPLHPEMLESAAADDSGDAGYRASRQAAQLDALRQVRALARGRDSGVPACARACVCQFARDR
jgi:hypothetical protein